MANTFDFFINIVIGGRTLRLDAAAAAAAASDVKNAVQNGFAVEYHADSFDNAFSLGTIAEAQAGLNSLMTDTLGGDPIDVTKNITDMLSGTALDKVAKAMTNDVELRITDLAFNTHTKAFTIGLGLNFGDSLTLDTPKLGLRSFGFVISHS